MTRKVVTLAVLFSLGFFIGCGSDGGGASLSSSFSNLSQIPSAEEMVSGNGSNSITFRDFSVGKFLKSGLDLQSVTGTPPTLVSLSSNNTDTYFWNGIVSYATTGTPWIADNTLWNQRKNQFWGQDTSTPGPGGQGACNMAQNVAESLRRMLEGGSTMCYMKNIGTVSSGLTVSGSAQSEIFNQTAGNKIVKIAVSNMTDGRGSRVNMNVFFRLYGTDAVGGDLYKYDMWMCQDGTPNQREALTVNKATGEITASQRENHGRSVGASSVTAYLTLDGAGNIIYDRSRTRSTESNYRGDWGTFKGSLTIDGSDIIRSKRYSSNDWGLNRDYSVSAFSGTSFENFRFLQAAYKGDSTPDGESTFAYNGVTEFRDTGFYTAVSSSNLSGEVDAYSFGGDSFFSDISEPSFNTSDLNCSVTPDVTATMDFSNPAIEAVKETCDGGKGRQLDYQMCWSNSVQTAMTNFFMH